MNPPDYFEEGDIQPNGAGVFGERRDIQVTSTDDFVRLISNQLMPVTLGEWGWYSTDLSDFGSEGDIQPTGASDFG